MNDFTATPDRDPNPPDPPVYCSGGLCDICTVSMANCPGTGPEAA